MTKELGWVTHDSPRLLEFFDLSQKNYLLGRGVYLIFTLKLAVLIIWYFTLKSYMQNTSEKFLSLYSARLTILILNQNSNDVIILYFYFQCESVSSSVMVFYSGLGGVVLALACSFMDPSNRIIFDISKLQIIISEATL